MPCDTRVLISRVDLLPYALKKVALVINAVLTGRQKIGEINVGPQIGHNEQQHFRMRVRDINQQLGRYHLVLLSLSTYAKTTGPSFEAYQRIYDQVKDVWSRP